MKNIKLILIITILIISNLCIFTNIAFNIKYKELISNYNQLSNNYKELEEKYTTQEQLLKEVMAKESFEEYTLKEKLIDILKLNKFTQDIKLENIKDIIKNLGVSIFK